jgi:tRNA(fMet)-specific endonuclease VapC
MMSGRFLLDTNIVIGMLRGDARIERRLTPATPVVVASVVLGELFFGALKSSRVDDNLRRVKELMSIVSVVGQDANTAYEYGLLKDELRQQGTPIPENDLWLAAVARQHDLTLVSRDHHFEGISRLVLTVW